MSFIKRYRDRKRWKSDAFPIDELKRHGLLPTPTTSQSDMVSCRYCNHRAFNWTDQADIPQTPQVLPWLHHDSCAEHAQRKAAGNAVARVYNSLRADGSQMRVVDLHPRATSAPFIRCSLRVVERSDRPGYQALSYRWGNKLEDKPFFILLNDHVWRVTPNLYHALESLQPAQLDRTLWVDALAINQFDDEEKSHQVRLMAEIYSSSVETQIWLNETLPMRQSTAGHDPLVFSGTTSDDSIINDFVREHVRFDTEMTNMSEPLTQMGRDCGCCANQPAFSSLKEEHYLGALCLLSQAARDCHLREMPFSQHHDGRVVHCSVWAFILLSLNAIVLSPWFKRVWIVQEAVLSPASIVHFRRYRFPFDMLLKAQRNLFRHKSDCCQLDHDQMPIMQQNTIRMLGEMTAHFKPEVVTKSNSLTYTVWRFLRQDAGDPRDKIFGVLSLMSDEYKACIGELLPNYKLSMQQCSIMAANFMATEIWGGRSLRMLSLVRKRFTDNADLPSWIPDWSTFDEFWHNRLYFTKAYRASGDVYIRPRVNNTFLALGNCGIDVVQQIGPSIALWTNGEHLYSTLAEWRRLAAVDGVTSPTDCHDCGQAECLKPSLDHRLDSFYRTLLSDRGRLNAVLMQTGQPIRATDSDVQDFARLMAWGEMNQASFQYELVPPDLQPIFNSLVMSLINRRFFVTRLGLFGLGPEEMMLGDELRVVFGSDVPYILRPAHNMFRWKFPQPDLENARLRQPSSIEDCDHGSRFQQDYLPACTAWQLRGRNAALQLQSQTYQSFVAAAFIDWGLDATLDLTSIVTAFQRGQQKTLQMMRLGRENPDIAEILERETNELQRRLAGQSIARLIENRQAAVQKKKEDSELYSLNPGGLTRTHRLIGDCYVHGIMDSQIVIGLDTELLSGSLTRTEVTPYDRIILG